MADYSLSDIANVARGAEDGGFGGGNWGLWIILFFAIFANGGMFGGGRGNGVTTEDLASSFNFSELNNKNDAILAAISGANQNIGNAICQLGYKGLQQAYELSRQLADCCCTTNQTFLSGIQSVKDMFRDYHEQNLREENMKNYIKSQFYGVVRYPLNATYAVNCNPFCNANQ